MKKAKQNGGPKSVSRPVEGFYLGIASYVIDYHTLLLYKNP